MATGFYTGGQLGISSVSFANTYSMYDPHPSAHYTKYNDSAGSTGVVCGMYGGYRFDFRDFFISSELDYNANTATIKNSHRNMGIEYKQSPSLGLHAIVGLGFGNSSEIYGRIGYTETVFKFEPETADNLSQKSEKLKGVVCGLGVQSHLNDQISIRLDYKYTMYNKVTAEFLDSTNSTVYKDKFSIKPEMHSLTLAAQYSF